MVLENTTVPLNFDARLYNRERWHTIIHTVELDSVREVTGHCLLIRAFLLLCLISQQLAVQLLVYLY